ncbi:zinc-binding alcohol dehydrogenase family protein [Rhodococcus sp. Eu-32]|uniref:zinc-binding alcohol dehydrogenase family protein n=1 Tax=Rhodococcus sp. Eu-32 TaxID=1017319 RepID=UPI000DF4A2C1|nr:zinc-binding alcohol dehydrogenase family protein [Rhodococcus sp. Eu-32]RRQ27181.1 zinc-binding alcohol dehydrogenase family protein [Rhodococcus sp. Eu-32]
MPPTASSQSSELGRVWRTTTPTRIDGNALSSFDEPRPRPWDGELLVRVDACGVCRTDLHVVEGDLPVHRAHVVPGHEVVGHVHDIGPRTETTFRVGDPVGIPWLRHTCGTCAFCRSGCENLCARSLYTGWDRDGGFAEWTVVPAAYALPLPGGYSTTELAPLLCAGIIGYRAFRLSGLPPSGKLGLYGFGASAHIVAQLARSEGSTVHVMTRDRAARKLALALGAASAQDTFDAPPENVDAAIVFAPIGEAVPAALEALAPGGTVVLAGIHMSDVPPLNYDRHLFHEKHLRSIESNTRTDARSFLERCKDTHLRLETVEYGLDQVPTALRDLSHGRFAGAAVVVM